MNISNRKKTQLYHFQSYFSIACYTRYTLCIGSSARTTRPGFRDEHAVDPFRQTTAAPHAILQPVDL